MPIRPALAVERKVVLSDHTDDAASEPWDGRCPECGGSVELTSYFGNDDLRSEEHWWCASCMLGLNIQVVRIVARTTTITPAK